MSLLPVELVQRILQVRTHIIGKQQIVQYEYVYGPGNTPNRKIEFYGDGTKIWGCVFGKGQRSWQKIGSVTEDDMIKEGMSGADKIAIMLAARKIQAHAKYPLDESFNDIPYAQKISVINNLAPQGNYRIMMHTSIDSNPFFEQINKITFFSPYLN